MNVHALPRPLQLYVLTTWNSQLTPLWMLNVRQFSSSASQFRFYWPKSERPKQPSSFRYKPLPKSPPLEIEHAPPPPPVAPPGSLAIRRVISMNSAEVYPSDLSPELGQRLYEANTKAAATAPTPRDKPSLLSPTPILPDLDGELAYKQRMERRAAAEDISLKDTIKHEIVRRVTPLEEPQWRSPFIPFIENGEEKRLSPRQIKRRVRARSTDNFNPFSYAKDRPLSGSELEKVRSANGAIKPQFDEKGQKMVVRRYMEAEGKVDPRPLIQTPAGSSYQSSATYNPLTDSGTRPMFRISPRAKRLLDDKIEKRQALSRVNLREVTRKEKRHTFFRENLRGVKKEEKELTEDAGLKKDVQWEALRRKDIEGIQLFARKVMQRNREDGEEQQVAGRMSREMAKRVAARETAKKLVMDGQKALLEKALEKIRKEKEEWPRKKREEEKAREKTGAEKQKELRKKIMKGKYALRAKARG